jgi:hypothetical protein
MRVVQLFTEKMMDFAFTVISTDVIKNMFYVAAVVYDKDKAVFLLP